MSDIYAQRGYGNRPLGFGAKIGVVVVDFQRGFIDPTFPMGGAEMVEEAVKNTVPLIEAVGKHRHPQRETDPPKV